MLNTEEDYSSENYISNNCKSQVGYIGGYLFKRSGNRACNNTDNISKDINQYTTDGVNNFKSNEVANLKKTYNSLLMV